MNIMNDRRITAREIERNIVNLRQLTFEVTDCCNLQCQYCGYGELYSGYDERKACYMNFEQIRPIIDYLVSLWQSHHSDSGRPLTYFSFYGGEPLLNMKFIKQVINYVDSLVIERRIAYSMTTNAMLLDKQMDYLAKHNFHLLISLDGDSEGQSYRVDHAGRNSFGRVFRNIKMLQEKYPPYK